MGKRKSPFRPLRNMRRLPIANVVPVTPAEVFQLQNVPANNQEVAEPQVVQPELQPVNEALPEEAAPAIEEPVDQEPANDAPAADEPSISRASIDREVVNQALQGPSRSPVTRTMSVDRELKSRTSVYHDPIDDATSFNDALPTASHYSIQSGVSRYYSAQSSQLGSLKDLRRRPSRDHSNDDCSQQPPQPPLQQEEEPQQSHSNLRPVKLSLRRGNQDLPPLEDRSRSDSVMAQGWWRRLCERWVSNRNYQPNPVVADDDDAQNHDGIPRRPNLASRFRRNSAYTVVPVTDDAGYARTAFIGGYQLQPEPSDNWWAWIMSGLAVTIIMCLVTIILIGLYVLVVYLWDL